MGRPMTAQTILVVEDEALVGMELQEGLVRLGYLVPEVLSRGEEVLCALERLSPDLILMDIRIAGAFDGSQVATLVRRVSNVPVVFLTAYGDPATLARVAIVDPAGYLAKPFGEAELAHSVALALAKPRAS